jgi:tetratricopeptide (TPR) repeat protein
MRGTTNENAYDAFIAGTTGFPVSSDAAFRRSVAKLKRALKLDPDYVRPRGWLAYAYLLSVTEGWSFKSSDPEAKWSEKKRLETAEQLAKEAVALDEGDYDTHWSLANVYVNTKRWKLAIKEFERAVYLCKSDNNPNLLVEMADALVHDGQHNRALRLVHKARRVQDWHRWVMAWTYFAKGRGDAIYYEFALEEIRAMHWHPGDDSYIADVKLLEAVISALKADKLKDAKQSPIVTQERKKAADALKHFKARKESKKWTLKQAEKFAPFRLAADKKHWLDGCKLAGLR